MAAENEPSADMPDHEPSREVRPWSPAVILMMTLLLPGGTLIAIRNLERLGQLTGSTRKQLTYATVVTLGLGLAILFAVSPVDQRGVPRPSVEAQTLTVFGVAVVSYLAQRPAFRAWRLSHAAVPTSPWLGAALAALLYTVVIAFVAALFYTIGTGAVYVLQGIGQG